MLVASRGVLHPPLLATHEGYPKVGAGATRPYLRIHAVLASDVWHPKKLIEGLKLI